MDNSVFEKLRKYETHLRRGYYGGYCYGLLSTHFEEMYEIYKTLGGRENLKYSCQACVLRLVKFVAEKFFKEKERLEKLEKEREKEREAVVEQPVEPEEKPKKRIRKKGED